MKNRILLILVCLTILHAQVHGQETDGLSRKQIRHGRAKYIQTGLGLNKGSMRDFATSPITYKGILFNYSLAWLKMDTARENKFTVRFNQGNYRYKKTDGIDVKSKATQYVLYLNYYRLYQLRRLSNEKWNVKLGGMYDVNMDVRINDDLMNAGIGYEAFSTFFLSGKVSRRFERKEVINKKFLFIKYKLKPMVTLFSYQLNLPVMNNSVRNGYAYIGNESLNTFPIFNGYEVKSFSGIRFCSELAYTRQMQNGNMYRVSYFWDAYAVGKNFNRFEVANHILEFSLLFHLNKNKQ
ncbi:MAG: hypothetical protein H6550_06100 [Chitinophagales bacterium]|nr:hypothetical protein [Chitinophagales bacterium]